jgi:predicted metal-dependent phosphoesterase TrpH
LGTAILHLHSTFSDGMSSVDELLDEVEAHGDIDILGITDHDDCRSFFAAQDWQERHPGARVQPIWGAEVTVFGFTHLLAFKMRPPFPTELPRKFLPLSKVVDQLNDMGCYVVLPHVDAPMVGIGRRRMARVAPGLKLFGYELLTPYFTPPESLPELRAIGAECDLVPLGGPDAHFIEDLYRNYLRFPGHTAADFERSWLERTVYPELGQEGPKKTLRRRLQQQQRSLIQQPSEQVRSWVRGRVALSRV